MEHVEKDGAERKDAPRAAKRPYARPELKVHGDVEKITEVLRLGVTKRLPDGSITDTEV